MSLRKLRSKDSRRRTIATIGVVIVVLAAAYGVVGFFDRERNRGGERQGREAVPAVSVTYPVHQATATVFWVGEMADAATNDNIHNRSSFWVNDWVSAFGGVDDPDDRCDGYRPCGFVPKENAFYCALPVGDYDAEGLKSAAELSVIPWHEGGVKEGDSVLKNRWIEVSHKGKTAYCQWEDVGPFGEDDTGYVFGSDRPKDQRAGIDVSPAVEDYIGLDGRGTVSWRFVDRTGVTEGPWTETVTTSGPQW